MTAYIARDIPDDSVRVASYAYVGAFTWCTVFIGIGYILGAQWENVLGDAPLRAGCVVDSGPCCSPCDCTFSLIGNIIDTTLCENEKGYPCLPPFRLVGGVVWPPEETECRPGVSRF